MATRPDTQRAARLIAKGKLGAALDIYERASSGNLTARHKAAEILARMGRIEEAVARYRTLIREHIAAGRQLKAVATCKMILELAPEDEEARAALASFHRATPATTPRPDGAPAPDDDLPPGPVPDDGAPDPLFADVSRDAFVALLERLSLRYFAAGEAVIREGERGSSMFIIVRGTARVFREDGGEAEPVASLREGTFFGEVGLLADTPRLATVRVDDEALLLELERDALRDVDARYPGVRAGIERVYKERLLHNLMRSSSVLQPFSLQQRSSLAEHFHLRHFDPGAVLVRQGERGRGLFFILRGSCEVFDDRDGQETHYPRMSEGDVFGEISLLFDRPVTATVRTASSCVILGISRRRFDHLVLPHPEVRESLRRLGAERFERTQNLLTSAGAPIDLFL